MVNEFHTVDGTCSTLVPSGPGYAGISLSNQVCTVVGSEPGQASVNGLRYLSLSFGYSYSHLWRVSDISSVCHVSSTKCRISAS